MPGVSIPTTVKYVRYNNYTFNENARVRITGRPVPDRANRVTAFVTYQIEVSTIIYSNSTDGYNTDTTVDDILVRLSKRSARLEIYAWGLGTWDINPAGPIKDINYGPIPKLLEVTPLGGSNAMMVRWFCETSIPECDGAYYERRPVSFNYEFEVRQDPRGFSTRIVTGELVIPANRIANTTSISDAADRYWETVLRGVPLLPGFKREHTRRLDDSKRVLTFTITDTEAVPNAFAADCTDWDGEEALETALLSNPGGLQPVGLQTGLVTLRATYHIARGRPKTLAWRLFSELFLNRNTAGKPFAHQGKSAIVTAYGIRNHLTSQEVTCSLTYFRQARSADALLAASGIMTPLPPGLYGWAKWAASMQHTALHPRGNAKLFYDASSDAIVSLCDDSEARMRHRGEDPGNPDEVILRGFRPTVPPPNQSYLRAELSLQLTGVARMVAHKPMQNVLTATDLVQSGNVVELTANGSGQGSLANTGSTAQAGYGWLKTTKFVEDIVQVSGAPERYAVLRARIWRAGHPVPPIAIIAVAGVPAILIRPSIIESHVDHSGVPIHMADIENVYFLPDFPRKRFPVPPTF